MQGPARLAKRLAVSLVVALFLAACTGGADEPSTSSTSEGTAPSSQPEQTTAPETTSAPETTAPAEGSGDSLRMWVGAEFEPVFHPVQACCAQDTVQTLIFNQLVAADEDSQTVISDLAVDWEANPDASEFTFTLADDVVWHDGEPFTADDVVWTANWSVANIEAFGTFVPTWSAIAGAQEVTDGTAESMSGIEAVDDQTVKITLAAPDAEFLRKLVEPQNAVLPEHILGDETAATIRQSEFVTAAPVGTGPYMLSDYQSDQYIELTANPDYFEGAPEIGRIFFMLYGSDAALAELETGELDLALDLDPREKSRLEAIDGLSVGSVPSAGIVRMELKNEAPPFDDVRVRQAVYYSIDRESICNEVLDGLCSLLSVNPGFMKYDGLNPYPYDPEQASALLEEAGYDGTPVRLMWDSGVTEFNTIFPIVGQFMTDAGFVVELQPTETNLFIDRLRFQRDTWESYVNSGGSELVSPDRTGVYFDCAYEGERGKWQTGYENCEMDAMFVEARQLSDQAARDEIYQEIATILNTDVPAIHLWSPANVFAYDSRLGGGFGIAPVDIESYADVETWTLGG